MPSSASTCRSTVPRAFGSRSNGHRLTPSTLLGLNSSPHLLLGGVELDVDGCVIGERQFAFQPTAAFVVVEVLGATARVLQRDLVGVDDDEQHESVAADQVVAVGADPCSPCCERRTSTHGGQLLAGNSICARHSPSRSALGAVCLPAGGSHLGCITSTPSSVPHMRPCSLSEDTKGFSTRVMPPQPARTGEALRALAVTSAYKMYTVGRRRRCRATAVAGQRRLGAPGGRRLSLGVVPHPQLRYQAVFAAQKSRLVVGLGFVNLRTGRVGPKTRRMLNMKCRRYIGSTSASSRSAALRPRPSRE